MDTDDGPLTDDDVDDIVADVISFHADDMRCWKEQLKGRTLAHWRAMVTAYSKTLSPGDVERVATACWHRAES